MEVLTVVEVEHLPNFKCWLSDYYTSPVPLFHVYLIQPESTFPKSKSNTTLCIILTVLSRSWDGCINP